MDERRRLGPRRTDDCLVHCHRRAARLLEASHEPPPRSTRLPSSCRRGARSFPPHQPADPAWRKRDTPRVAHRPTDARAWSRRRDAVRSPPAGGRPRRPDSTRDAARPRVAPEWPRPLLPCETHDAVPAWRRRPYSSGTVMLAVSRAQARAGQARRVEADCAAPLRRRPCPIPGPDLVGDCWRRSSCSSCSAGDPVRHLQPRRSSRAALPSASSASRRGSAVKVAYDEPAPYTTDSPRRVVVLDLWRRWGGGGSDCCGRTGGPGLVDRDDRI